MADDRSKAIRDAANKIVDDLSKNPVNDDGINISINTAYAPGTEPQAPIMKKDEEALLLSIVSHNLLQNMQKADTPVDKKENFKSNLPQILKRLTKSLQDANSAYLAGGGKQAKPKSKKPSTRSAKKVSRKKATKRGGGGVAANAADIMNSTGLLRTSNDPLTQANSPAIIALTRQDPAVTAGMTGLSAIDATSDFPSSVTGEIVHNLGGLYL